MTLTEWDKRVATQLRAIDEHAAWVAHHCEYQIRPHVDKMRIAVERLKERPQWPFIPVKAEAGLEEALAKLETQFCAIRSLLELYRAKPVVVEDIREAV